MMESWEGRARFGGTLAIVATLVGVGCGGSGGAQTGDAGAAGTTPLNDGAAGQSTAGGAGGGSDAAAGAGGGDALGGGDAPGPGDAPGGGATAELMIGPAGGTLQSPDGKLTLKIPAGAVATPTMFMVEVISPAPAGAVGPAYRLEPEGTIFDRYVEIAISFSASDWQSLKDPRDLAIMSWDGKTWAQAELGVVDGPAYTVSALSHHLSTWAPAPRSTYPKTNPCICDVNATKSCCQAAGGVWDGNCACTLAGGLFINQAMCQASEKDLNARTWGFSDCYFASSKTSVDLYHCSQSWRDCCRAAGGIGPAYPGSSDCTCVFGCESYFDDQAALTKHKEKLDKCVADAEQAGKRLYNSPPRCTSEIVFGYCEPCPDLGARGCTNLGGACSFGEGPDRSPDGQVTNGKCAMTGNKCGECRPNCAPFETCGNRVDDDCNGLIDDLCEARRCVAHTDCSKGSACQGGYCEACRALAAGQACTTPGAPCSFMEGAGVDGQMITGRCHDEGNGCGRCDPQCHDTETCANGVDDDCNGKVDDGCPARASCTSHAQCGSGQVCWGGRCTACTPAPAGQACSVEGAACSYQEARGPDTQDPSGSVTVNGRCRFVGTSCGRCDPTCKTTETCGNFQDDDCNGKVDDGCPTLRSCTTHLQCQPGEACTGGFCRPCEATPTSCQALGAACSFQLMREDPTAPAMTANGKCAMVGNGCGSCETSCQAIETCNNKVDDDCNGSVDDGCDLRLCAADAVCVEGQACRK